MAIAQAKRLNMAHIFGPILSGSMLKLIDPSFAIRGPVAVKRAEFIRDRKVRTKLLLNTGTIFSGASDNF